MSNRITVCTGVILDVTIEPWVSSALPIWRLVIIDPGSRTHEAEEDVLGRFDDDPRVPSPNRRRRRRDPKKAHRHKRTQLAHRWREPGESSRVQNFGELWHRAQQQLATADHPDSVSGRCRLIDSYRRFGSRFLERSDVVVRSAPGRARVRRSLLQP